MELKTERARAWRERGASVVTLTLCCCGARGGRMRAQAGAGRDARVSSFNCVLLFKVPTLQTSTKAQVWLRHSAPLGHSRPARWHRIARIVRACQDHTCIGCHHIVAACAPLLRGEAYLFSLLFFLWAYLSHQLGKLACVQLLHGVLLPFP